MSIGERIKKSRNERGLSLRELATRVELSASFLSQIEQGKASPSIENLKKIATCLDVRVSYLIEDEEVKKNSDLMKREDRKYVESIDSNTKIALLTSSNIEKNMEPILYEIGPRGESGRSYYNHPGEEFIFIVEGSLDVYIEDGVYTLREGDSFYFKSSQKHRFKNNTDHLVRAIWVVTPPTF
ncbi:MAG: cupin domain-containing protein [Cetobacterium sp.]|uniref:Transcriptional regulator, XRE family with cupin sensor n=1 Tax=Cetobacterium ceti TaxID=180163 RepID=A0A1T4PZD7_9FUSO|nr:cupin domain-containing protein [Cetobacterium ceti]MCJ8341303.1 cupin domain-containing protein [Cetobacterium sp.]SJZ96894.1 transcriptional regulator, XRE family with cupin sensor [Cetobacterium ceti]